MGRDQTLGRLRPTYGTVRTPGTRSYGPAAVEALADIGVDLFPWQREWFDEILEVDDGGNLTRRTAVLVLSRRNGKTLAIAARALVGILFLDEPRFLYTAHTSDTANEIFGMMRELVSAPAVAPHVRKVYESNGKERIEFHNGGRFQVRTRTEHGGRGRETDAIAFDEAMVLHDSSVAALRPLTARAAARGRGQVLFTSSAGSLDESSAVLLGLRDQGRPLHGTTGNGVSYWEFCAEPGDPVDDPATWAKANPSLGSEILSTSYLESQLAGGMSLEAFRREHLGVWAESGDLPAIDPEAWAACASGEAVEVDPDTVTIAFDVSLDRIAARLVAVARALDGRTVVRVLRSWSSVYGIDAGQVEAAVVEAYDALAPVWIGYDKLGGGDIAARLEARRYPVKAFSGPAIANACGVLKRDVLDGRLVHDGDETLAGDLGRAVAKPYGDGGWLFTRKAVTSGPIAGAIALSVGYALVQLAAESESTVVSA